MRKFIVLTVVTLIHSAICGRGDLAFSDELANHLTLPHGVWAETDLPDLPGKLLTGSLDLI